MEGNKVKVSLDGAIEVMYKGFVYEEQWNDKNKKANRDFLQELLDKKAAKCTQGAKSKKDAKGSTTSAPAAANGDATAATGNANDTMAPAGNAAQAPRVVRGKKGRKNKKRAGK
jgi:hypothetical protein